MVLEAGLSESGLALKSMVVGLSLVSVQVMLDPGYTKVNYILETTKVGPLSECKGQYSTGMGLWGLIRSLGHRIHPGSWELAGPGI